jgi:hypothetical protein
MVKDATGTQLRKVGGWFILLAKHVKAREFVGRVLTAEQVFNLWERMS